MSNSKHNQDRCEVLAKEKLVGRTITEVRYLTAGECDVLGLGYESTVLGIWFDNHSYMFASPEDTDEGPAGTLLGGSQKTLQNWSFPPVKIVREDPERELTDDERARLDSMTDEELERHGNSVSGGVCFDNYRPDAFDFAVRDELRIRKCRKERREEAWCPGDKLGGVCPGIESGVNSDCPKWKEEG